MQPLLALLAGVVLVQSFGYCTERRQQPTIHEVAPEETVEPPDDVEEGEKLKKRAERLEAARTRAASAVRKHLKALLVPAARGDAGKVD